MTDTVQRTERKPDSRRLTRGLFLWSAWLTAAAAAALGRAAYLRGEAYIPSMGDEYTASIVIWPGTLWPVALVVMYTAMFGHFVGVCLVVAGVARLADPAARADRRAWRWLLAGTLLAAVIVVLAFSPPGESVRYWILD